VATKAVKKMDRGTRLPARVQFIGDPKDGSKVSGTAVRFTQQDNLKHYEVHTDRGSNLLVHEDELELLNEAVDDKD
jgi:hypothetical protein